MTLENLNILDATAKTTALRHCCGSQVWVDRMLAGFPYSDQPSLLAAAARNWRQCSPADWLEAFHHHPKIGARTTDATAAAEQSGASSAPTDILQRLATDNQRYEERFGYIFIVCATGKSAYEMLGILNTRLDNPTDEELRIAMTEQEKITLLRLQKLLA
ncbi:2-oxo-4-hydroxy-4-carboxy-5-ureidoimidazoline decarboxylase [Puia sp.]|jgi:2-oxo-4-hydroxy-4-carboxy-5-ureidoimidazoline decarboxylase|uniref:2-oxo-4-hydroxy-4-carboxy-5-ureidoimidazoline decarboxylase n=1 Tax=Puia sp. TaxID=2045100 RepID=UPI002F42801D